jgi:DNA mismatch repair protein MutS2
MNPKSIEALGFPTIVGSITAHCRSHRGASYVKNLPFVYERAALVERQATITECRSLFGFASDSLLVTFPEIEPFLSRLKDHSTAADGQELLDVAHYINAAHSLFEFLHTTDEEGEGFGRAQALMGPSFPEELQQLAKEITTTLDEAGQVRESHPAIASLMRQVEAQRTKRASFCRSFIAANPTAVQTDQEALRDGRLVIPIKREAHSQIDGFVSTASASGNTLFMEPFALVELNNSVVMAQNQILIEIAKILDGLATQVRDTLRSLLKLIKAVGRSDGMLAIARWTLATDSSATDLEGIGLKILEARHPLLGKKAVPITLVLDDEVRAVVFSGPNAGGKTVSIKTVGLFGLLNQFCGYMPAKEGSCLPLFDGIWTDIGDEQSIDDELSTFSGHMKQIAKILQGAGPASLILLDELGSGTDPVEGSALAQSILEYAQSRSRLTLVTSHHTHLKQFAYAKREVINASMAFDEASLEPTFTIVVGLPGESHGLDMARQMGLPKEVIGRTETLLGSEQMKLSAIIKDLESKRLNLEKSERALIDRRRALQQEVKEVQLRELRLKQEQASLKRGQLTSLERFTRQKRSELEQLVATLRREGVDRSKAKVVKEAIGELEGRIAEESTQLQQLIEEVEHAQTPSKPHHFEVGMDVFCGPSKREGKIIEKIGKDRYVVAIDVMRMTLRARDLTPAQRVEPTATVLYASSARRPHPTLDVRGLTLEEALEALAIQIEGALVHGMENFSIIHGYGDGILSRGIGEYLKTQRAVKDFRFALPEDGGMGKTYVML